MRLRLSALPKLVALRMRPGPVGLEASFISRTRTQWGIDSSLHRSKAIEVLLNSLTTTHGH